MLNTRTAHISLSAKKMASSNSMAFLAMLLVLLPMAAKGDNIPPSLAPFYDNICNGVECGKGSCQAAPDKPFNYICQCENGWKRTRLDDEETLQFLPCVIPNCTLNYSCMPAAPPAPPIPYNFSFFDPCYWTYCGEGSCQKNISHIQTCQCNPGYYNLLNVSAFPCFSECALGSADCDRLGIRISNSTTSTPSNGNEAFLPGKLHWITMLVTCVGMILWR
ncbi:hypothetical protein F0562_019669 [Nyssa sinensis]|uniref:EGF-like domain-containing protein n=1 Tax=Nyssa sinensis TaxID=561372 RepID=A0A5J5BQN5_9ASTE|nr:hypothetical protein F0562_019669 [Nyssa sinensis]